MDYDTQVALVMIGTVGVSVIAVLLIWIGFWIYDRWF